MSAAIEREFEELDAQNRWQQLYLVSGRLTEPPPSPSEDRARARRRPPPPPPPVGAEVAARVRRPGPLRFGARGGGGGGGKRPNARRRSGLRGAVPVAGVGVAGRGQGAAEGRGSWEGRGTVAGQPARGCLSAFGARSPPQSFPEGAR